MGLFLCMSTISGAVHSRGVANSMKFPIVDQQIIRSNKNDLLFSWTQHSGHSLSNNIMYHR